MFRRIFKIFYLFVVSSLFNVKCIIVLLKKKEIFATLSQIFIFVWFKFYFMVCNPLPQTNEIEKECYGTTWFIGNIYNYLFKSAVKKLNSCVQFLQIPEQRNQYIISNVILMFSLLILISFFTVIHFLLMFLSHNPWKY